MSTGDGVVRRARAVLRPDERFRAAVLALARDDADEVDHLAASCPLTVRDRAAHAFFARLNELRTLAAGAQWLGHALRQQAELAAAYADLLDRSIHASTEEAIRACWEAAMSAGVELDDVALAEARKLAAIRSASVAAAARDASLSAHLSAAAFEVALDRFAHDLAFEPETFRAALGQPHRAEGGLPEPDRDAVDAVLGHLRWLFGLEPNTELPPDRPSR